MNPTVTNGFLNSRYGKRETTPDSVQAAIRTDLYSTDRSEDSKPQTPSMNTLNNYDVTEKAK